MTKRGRAVRKGELAGAEAFMMAPASSEIERFRAAWGSPPCQSGETGVAGSTWASSIGTGASTERFRPLPPTKKPRSSKRSSSAIQNRIENLSGPPTGRRDR